ncbi:hypothetical protein IAD21_05901 [Abditibacteriota bacterium]|nr:hypothetical protein IAD21_05901 [Abditibacteriota bacterium]
MNIFFQLCGRVISDKKTYTSAYIALLAFLLMAWPARSQAVYEADYMNQALKRVFRKSEAVTNVKDKVLAGYGFDPQGACLWGAYLKVGNENTLDTQLQAGRSYFFIGAGDDYVKNVDVLITNTKGRVLAKDIEGGKEAGVLFKPKYSGPYKVILRLKAGDRFGLCALACLKRPDGWVLNRTQFLKMTDVFKSDIEGCWKSYKGGRFLRNGQWCLVMGVVPQGRPLSWNHKIPPGLLAIKTAQVGSSRELNLYLFNASRGIVASNTEGEATPGFTYYSHSGGTYRWEVAGHSTHGLSFVGVALLELPTKN